MKNARAGKPPIPMQAIELTLQCTASWEGMQGDERARHCDDCNKNVVNISAMPQADAAALLKANVSGDLCVRFYQRQDGTMMNSDCSDSARAVVRQAWGRLPHMAGAAMLAFSVAGCAVNHPPAPGAPAVDAAALRPQPPEVPVMPTMGVPPPEYVQPTQASAPPAAAEANPAKKTRSTRNKRAGKAAPVQRR